MKKLVFLIGLCVLFILLQQRDKLSDTLRFALNPPTDYSRVQAEVALSDPRLSRVTMYSIDHCPYCDKTRRFLEARKVAFRELNIEHSTAARAEFDGLLTEGLSTTMPPSVMPGVPLTLINERRIIGFQPDAFTAALDEWFLKTEKAGKAGTAEIQK